MEYSYNALGSTTEKRFKNAGGATVNTIRYYYDALDRRCGINWNPGNATPGSNGGRELPRRMEYDDNDNVVAEIDGRGNRTEYVYDAYNRRTRVIYADRSEYPGGNDAVTVYDLVGNAVERTDGRGIHKHYRFDDGSCDAHFGSVRCSAVRELVGNAGQRAGGDGI